MPVDPKACVRISAFNWVPPFAARLRSRPARTLGARGSRHSPPCANSMPPPTARPITLRNSRSAKCRATAMANAAITLDAGRHPRNRRRSAGVLTERDFGLSEDPSNSWTDRHAGPRRTSSPAWRIRSVGKRRTIRHDGGRVGQDRPHHSTECLEVLEFQMRQGNLTTAGD